MPLKSVSKYLIILRFNAYIIPAKTISRENGKSPSTLELELYIKPTVPMRPINKPIVLIQLARDLNKIIPIIRVEIGVTELRMPARELVIWVCPIANKYDGIALPIKATSNK